MSEVLPARKRLTDTHFAYFPAEELAVFHGDYQALRLFIKNGAWREPVVAAVALQPAFDEGRWYLFAQEIFLRRANEWMGYPEAYQDLAGLLDLFELTADHAVDTITPSETHASETSLVLDPQEAKKGQAVVGAYFKREANANQRGPRPAPEIMRRAATSSGPVRRTPHLDLDAGSPPPPGGEFTVRVYADGRPRQKDESGRDIIVRDPAQRTEYSLSVWLKVSEHFEVLGSDLGVLRLRRDQDTTNVVEFRVRSVSVEPAGRGWLMASISYQGRSCGRVTRSVRLKEPSPAGPETDMAVAESPAADGTLQVDGEAVPPDLSLSVAGPDGRGYYRVLVRTKHLADYAQGRTERWRPAESIGTFVAERLRRFAEDNLSAKQRLAALRGAGGVLFNDAPAIFREAVIRLLAAGALGTLLVVSDEPHFPWELLVPPEPDGSMGRSALGAQCAVGRWLDSRYRPAPQKLAIARCCVVAPAYDPDSEELPPLQHSVAESGMVRARFPGEEAEPADYDGLTQALEKRPVELLHFICHGDASTNQTMQRLVLAGANCLTSSEVSGSRELAAAFGESRPLVFLNACEVGRTSVALTGVGGFAEAFISIGASAVIAPLWEADDGVAHEVARAFYHQPAGRSAAETLREIRCRSYDGEEEGVDTYAAYCFYGDPSFVVAAPEPGS